MKAKTLFVFLILISANQLFSQSCKLSIPSTQLSVDANNYNLLPGDTICIEAGNRDYLKISNLHGDSLNYIIVINKGGSVNIQNNYHMFGVNFANCSYFRFTGTGSDSVNYGFKINGSKLNTNALSIDMKSTNYEIDHIEIANAGFAGIMAKTDPQCNLSSNRGYFTQYQTSIHDNYIRNTEGEGLYIGHSFYNGYPTTCSGQPDTLYPHDIKGLRVYNNILENCKWDGIQIGCAVEDCEIFNNRVINYGVSQNNSQMAGIQIGGGTTGKCYNNFIANGSGSGINIFGLGNVLVFNNIVINAGKNYFPGDLTKSVFGIFCDDRTTIAGSPFNIINNTIVNPKNDGIRFYSLQSSNNKLINNLIVNPGSLGTYSNNNQSYINLKTGVNASLSNNYYSPDFTNLKLIDTLLNNYKPTVLSPLVNAGYHVGNLGIVFDFDYYPRPYSTDYDIGAYEYYPGNAIENLTETTETISIFPNPSKGIFNISINSEKESKKANIIILNQLGEVLLKKQCYSDELQSIDISKIAKSGIYFIILHTENYHIIKKLIIQ